MGNGSSEIHFRLIDVLLLWAVEEATSVSACGPCGRDEVSTWWPLTQSLVVG
jgi:hypothetical protein